MSARDAALRALRAVKRPAALALLVAIVGCRPGAPRLASLAQSSGEAHVATRDASARDAAEPEGEPEAPRGPRCATQLALLRPRAGSIATVGEDRSAPVLATCARLQRDAERTLRPLRRAQDIDVAELGPFGRCLAAGRGAWFITPLAATARLARRYMNPTDRGWELRVRWRVDYVDAQGARHEGAVDGEAFHSDPSDEQLSTILQYDSDGDGVAELVLGSRSTNFEGGDSMEAMQLAWRFGQAALDPRVQGLELREPVDPDGDGRVDFVQPSPFELFSMGSSGPRVERGPTTLAHRLEDGTFSRDDAVAKAFVLAQCLDGEEPVSMESGDDRVILRLVCDRLFGANAAALAQRLDALEAEGVEVPTGELRAALVRGSISIPFDRCAP